MLCLHGKVIFKSVRVSFNAFRYQSSYRYYYYYSSKLYHHAAMKQHINDRMDFVVVCLKVALGLHGFNVHNVPN